MNPGYTPNSEQWIDHEVRNSLRVIRQQRAARFAAMVALAVLGVAALLVMTHLGLT